jgi:epoxyqueuosine reductase
MSTTESRIRDRAAALGFDAVGIARADEPLGLDHERYLGFLEAGRHGEMAYLAENVEARRRLDTDAILPGARSVLCLAVRYARPGEADEAPPGSVASQVARYARGRDYHNGIRKRLRKLADFVRGLGEGVEARPLLDTAPVLERAWAARSGLGFLGKNGLIIVPGQGSYLLLGEVVTTLALLPDVPLAERCGSCTRCLDACPTGAFVGPFVLDPRRCVAYLTIEARGPVPIELREGVGEHLFGCDVCQEVCPFNRTRPPPPDRTEPFVPLDRWRRLTAADLLATPAEAWPALREGTAMHRAPPAALLRNAITVVALRGDRGSLDALRQLLDHEDEAVRIHARWALDRLAEGQDAAGSNRLAEGEDAVGRDRAGAGEEQQ